VDRGGAGVLLSLGNPSLPAVLLLPPSQTPIENVVGIFVIVLSKAIFN
jgi:hypothetical protein